MPGPPPVPTEVLKLRGSWLAKKRHGEPQPQRGQPKLPPSLGKAERGVWRAVCKILDDMGVLTVADGGQLERYAVYFVRWRACIAFLTEKDAEAGTLVPPGCYFLAGEFKPYPTVNQVLNLDKALRAIEAQFGLTPAARARLVGSDKSGQPTPPTVWSRKRG